MVGYQTIDDNNGRSSSGSVEQGMNRRYAYELCYDASPYHFLIRRRSSRSKDVGFTGQASWLSSNINLVNTSMISSSFEEWR